MGFADPHQILRKLTWIASHLPAFLFTGYPFTRSVSLLLATKSESYVKLRQRL